MQRHSYGDLIQLKKASHCMRVILQNPQRIPINGRADQSTQFMANIKDHKPDVVLLDDVGLFWKNVHSTTSGKSDHEYPSSTQVPIFLQHAHRYERKSAMGRHRHPTLGRSQTQSTRKTRKRPRESGQVELGPNTRKRRAQGPDSSGIQTMQEPTKRRVLISTATLVLSVER